MSDIFGIVEGWTGVIGPFTLKVDGAAIALTGFTVAISLRNKDGAVAAGGTVTVDPDQVTHKGQVSYTPVATDFTFDPSGPTSRQEYHIHWKVTDGAGKVVYFPNGRPDTIGVYPA